MKCDMDRVWLRGLCILSAILLGTSMGGVLQTASAADQTVDMTGPIAGASDPEPQNHGVVHLKGNSVAHTRPGNYIFAAGTNDLVPLTPAGLLESDTFFVSGQVLVFYTAECAVSAAAGNLQNWLSIDMSLRDVLTNAVTNLSPATPNSADAFCTSNGTADIDGYVSAAIIGVATVPAGNYKARVSANLQGAVDPGDLGWLGDSTLVIKK